MTGAAAVATTNTEKFAVVLHQEVSSMVNDRPTAGEQGCRGPASGQRADLVVGEGYHATKVHRYLFRFATAFQGEGGGGHVCRYWRKGAVAGRRRGM